MYKQTQDSKYLANVDYYVYNASISDYVLLVAGTDYTIGSTISGTVYNKFEYDRLYIRPWGSTGHYEEFPYRPDGMNNTLPEHDVGANDVDLDAYTNTAGRTIRGRVRHDVASLDFNVPTMNGEELHQLFDRTTNVWLDCYFFYESAWDFVSLKMYRSGTVKYHKYYVDSTNPNKNIYTDINFGFVEE